MRKRSSPRGEDEGSLSSSSSSPSSCSSLDSSRKGPNSLGGLEGERRQAGLDALRVNDPSIIRVVAFASFATAFVFSNGWTRSDVEGVLFVVHRDTQPHYRMIILNQRNPKNLVEDITSRWEICENGPYVFFRVPEGDQMRMVALWISDDAQRSEVYAWLDAALRGTATARVKKIANKQLRRRLPQAAAPPQDSDWQSILADAYRAKSGAASAFSTPASRSQANSANKPPAAPPQQTVVVRRQASPGAALRDLLGVGRAIAGGSNVASSPTEASMAEAPPLATAPTAPAPASPQIGLRPASGTNSNKPVYRLLQRPPAGDSNLKNYLFSSKEDESRSSEGRRNATGSKHRQPPPPPPPPPSHQQQPPPQPPQQPSRHRKEPLYTQRSSSSSSTSSSVLAQRLASSATPPQPPVWKTRVSPPQKRGPDDLLLLLRKMRGEVNSAPAFPAPSSATAAAATITAPPPASAYPPLQPRPPQPPVQQPALPSSSAHLRTTIKGSRHSSFVETYRRSVLARQEQQRKDREKLLRTDHHQAQQLPAMRLWTTPQPDFARSAAARRPVARRPTEVTWKHEEWDIASLPPAGGGDGFSRALGRALCRPEVLEIVRQSLLEDGWTEAGGSTLGSVPPPPPAPPMSVFRPLPMVGKPWQRYKAIESSRVGTIERPTAVAAPDGAPRFTGGRIRR